MTPEERTEIVKRLSQPFDLREVKWRVTNTANNGKRGVVMPYADPRAYKDRLNAVLSTAGWSETYSVTVVEHSIRRKGDNAEMITGKILVTCVVSIPGVGQHSGTGEEWSDAACAMTSADAQAFKRGCSSFGLGRYLYSIPEQWVDLDDRKRPKQIPVLPDWSKPANSGHATSTPIQARGEVQRPSQSNRQLDREKVNAVESYRQSFGDDLYLSQLIQIAGVNSARDIRDAETADKVLAVMNRTFGGLQKARVLAENMSEGRFFHVMDRLNIRSLDTIPNVQKLIELVRALDDANKRAA
jgi:hypothetical protein